MPLSTAGRIFAELAIKKHPNQKRRLRNPLNARYHNAISRQHFLTHIRENVKSINAINENSPYSVPLNYGLGGKNFNFMKQHVIPKLTNKAKQKFIKFASR
jgi:hypothetical protein